MSKFQLILLGVFGFFIIVAVAVFALYRGSGSDTVKVTIWGDISSRDFNQFTNSAGFTQDKNISITYVEKSTETLETEFTEALARGGGPDLILIAHDKLWKEKSKLLVIPYSSVSVRDFQQTFIEEGELFLDPSGIYGLPLSSDPMVLYYNRDLLSSAGIAKPIGYWDEIYNSASKLTKKDQAGNLTQSIMALGEARNIAHAKEILSLLLLQAGTPITRLVGSQWRAELMNNFNLPVSPAESALEFYTQFSNPAKSFYSWNRSLIDAQTNFTSGSSAYYLGFASELGILRSKNPTLNFAVAPTPQSRVSGKTTTFGRLLAVSISRGTKDPSGALAVATKLVSNGSAKVLSEILDLPSARRDLLSDEPDDATLSVFYDGALQARGWLDPNASMTRDIFHEAIESITSGRARTSEAINKANSEINALIK